MFHSIVVLYCEKIPTFCEIGRKIFKMKVDDGNHNRDFTAQRAIGARMPKIVSELEQN